MGCRYACQQPEDKYDRFLNYPPLYKRDSVAFRRKDPVSTKSG
jgi:hypothetical protein